MNKQHGCIKFSIETERNNAFSFLDINTTRQNKNIKLKHLFIENLLSVVFLHTMEVTLINLTRSHWFSICFLAVILFAWTTHTLFHLKVEKLREIFKKNSYPSSVIKLSIRFFLSRLYVPKQIYSTAPKTELLIILSFLGTIPLDLTGKLQTSLRNSLTQRNIKVISKSTNDLSFLFRLKDVIPKEFSHLVYKLSCSRFNAT